MHRLLFALLLTLLPAAMGCRQPPPPSAAEVDDVYSLLRRVGEFYQKTNTFEVDYVQEMTVEHDGASESLQSEATIIAQRPNRFALRNRDPDQTDIICNGSQVWMSVPSSHKYTQSVAPSSLDEILKNAGPIGRRPLIELFVEQPYEQLMQIVRRADYIGNETLDDVEVDHLRFDCDQFVWDAWIAADERPRLLKAAFEMSNATTQGSQRKTIKLVSVQQYKNWRFDETLADDAFAFQPPADAQKLDHLTGGGDEPKRSPLVGRPAPDVELVLLNGRRLRLKELTQEKVVVLDFWATWCGPCRQEMPLVAQVADEFADDVALYCVNQGESAEDIFPFIQEEKLKAPVTLDVNGEASAEFGARALPTLVMINTSGVIQAVHIGFRPDIGDILKEEIRAVLAGKNLADEDQKQETRAASD